MRAEQPVPVGERSTLPGRIATALAPVHAPFSATSGPANWQKEMWRQSGFSGWTKPSCALAAATMRMPVSAMSRASSGAMRKPSAPASTMTKLSPP